MVRSVMIIENEYVHETCFVADFVTLMLSSESEAENAKEKLKEKLPIIVKMANEYKKPGAEK